MVGGVPGTGGRYRLGVSYYGSIVLSRSGSLLTALPRVEAIGYRHRRLRELGEGWQVLETTGWDDPPDMAEAVGLLAGVWEAPVLAAYVSESHCAQLHGALPGAAAWSTHLPYPADSDCGYLHRPATEPGGTIEHARALVTGWAEGAGLSASDARLDLILRQSEPPVFDEHHHDRDHDHTAPDDLVFELVRALGFRDIPAPRRYDFDPDEEPFAGVVEKWRGLADKARSAAAHRANGRDEDPPAVWEAEAIRLQCDVYASLYGGAHSPADLAARAEWVLRTHRAAKDGTQPPPAVRLKGDRPAATRHLIDDIAPRVVADHIAVHAARPDADVPNGVRWGDSTEGRGRWPDLD